MQTTRNRGPYPPLLSPLSLSFVFFPNSSSPNENLCPELRLLPTSTLMASGSRPRCAPHSSSTPHLSPLLQEPTTALSRPQGRLQGCSIGGCFPPTPPLLAAVAVSPRRFAACRWLCEPLPRLLLCRCELPLRSAATVAASRRRRCCLPPPRLMRARRGTQVDGYAVGHA
jgi:hypothetical protein